MVYLRSLAPAAMPLGAAPGPSNNPNVKVLGRKRRTYKHEQINEQISTYTCILLYVISHILCTI